MATPARAPAPRIDLGKLPKWKEDDISFVVGILAARYLDKTTTIAGLVRALGLRVRKDNDSPTDEYYRVRAALHAAHERKLVKRSGQRWGLP